MAKTSETAVSKHIQDLDEQLDRLMSDFEPPEQKAGDRSGHDFGTVVDDEDFETRLSEIEQFDIIARELEDGNDIRHSGAWFLAQLEVQDDGEEATKRYVQIRRQSMSDPGRAQLLDDLSVVSEEWGQQQLHSGVWLKVAMESDQAEIRKILYVKNRLQLIADERKKQSVELERKRHRDQENEKLERDKREEARKARAQKEEREKRDRRVEYVIVRLENAGFQVVPLEWGWTLTKIPEIENKRINSYDELIEFARDRGIEAQDDIDPELIRRPQKKENSGCFLATAIFVSLVILWLILG